MRTACRCQHRRGHAHASRVEVRQQRHLERHIEFATGPDGVQPRHIPLPVGGTQGVVVIQAPANQVALLHRNAVVLRHPTGNGCGGGGGVGGNEIGIGCQTGGHDDALSMRPLAEACPHGLDDLFGLRVRHNPTRAAVEQLMARHTCKRWLEQWPLLNMVRA